MFVENQGGYFFHDVSTYEKLIREQVPTIDSTTMLYLKEAMQAFRSGCILSATVMIGVAAEHTFLRLLETVDGNAAHEKTYATVKKERHILPKINKFHGILASKIGTLPPETQEDLDTNFVGIQAVFAISETTLGTLPARSSTASKPTCCSI